MIDSKLQCQSTSDSIFPCQYLFAHTPTCFESRELFSSNFISRFSLELSWSYSAGANITLWWSSVMVRRIYLLLELVVWVRDMARVFLVGLDKLSYLGLITQDILLRKLWSSVLEPMKKTSMADSNSSPMTWIFVVLYTSVVRSRKFWVQSIRKFLHTPKNIHT